MSEQPKSIFDEYFALNKQYISEYGKTNTIVLMQVGGFYEMYGLQDAVTMETKRNEGEPRITEFGQICELEVVPKSKVSYGSSKQYNVLMCGFKNVYVDKHVRKMQKEGYTIVIYNQEPGATKDAKKNHTLFTIVSPGTYIGTPDNNSSDFNNEMTVKSNTICCLWFYLKDMQSSILGSKSTKNNGSHRIYVGMSSVDICTGKTVLYEFERTYYPKLNNPNLFDPLDRFLTIYTPVELIVMIDCIQTETIVKILNNVNTQNVHKTHMVLLSDNSDATAIAWTKEDNISNAKNVGRAKNCEKQIYQREVLSRFYPGVNSNDMYMHKFSEYIFATQSFCYLLDFIHQHNTTLTKQISLPVFDNVGENLLLENSSLIQLNILDDGKQINHKYASVAKMCTNEARTSMGKRKITEMILHPTTNAIFLEREYAVIDSAIAYLNIDAKKQKVHDWISAIRDLSQYLRLIYWKRISPKQLFFLYESIQNAKELYNYFLKDPDMHAYFQATILEYSHLLVSMGQITSFLDSVLNIDKCKSASENIGDELFILKKTANIEFNRDLSTLYDSRDQLECCRTFLDELLKNNNNNKPSEKYGEKEEEKEGDKSENEDEEEDSAEFGSNNGRSVKINCTKTGNFTISATEIRCEEISERLKKMHVSVNATTPYSFINISYMSSNTQQLVTLSLKIGEEPIFSNKKRKTNKVATEEKTEKQGKQTSLKPVIDFVKTSSCSTNRYIKSTQIDEYVYTLGFAKKNIANTIKQAYLDILEQLETYDKQILNVIQYISGLDSILARANMAENNGYCRPELCNNPTCKNENEENKTPSFVDAKNLRHCIIEKIQTDEIYVANDVSLNARGILLYGVNAVGKTSLIRSLGIAIIMAQSGFFVPATKFVYKPYTKLFTRILGNDCLAKGLSTFVVEMLELNPILQYADQNSIVLGDELCSGTETPSAISLNLASLIRMCGRNVSFILATHYHELVEMEEIKQLSNLTIMHMSMFFDRGKDQLVYNRKLQMGVGSNRYGLEVCKSLKMPDDFIEMANEFRMKYYADVGSASILDQKTSTYNAEHIRGLCEKCTTTMATEVHHKLPQKLANKNGLITDFITGSVIHKNHAANLLSVCEKCHLEFHHPRDK